MKRYSQLATKYIKKNKSEFMTTLIPLTLTVMILFTSALLGRYYIDMDKELGVKSEGEYDVRLIDIDKDIISKVSKSTLVKDYAIGKNYGVSVLNTELDYRYAAGYIYNKVELYGVDNKVFTDDFLGINIVEGKMPKEFGEVVITNKTLQNLISNGYKARVGNEIELEFETNRTGDDYIEFDIAGNEFEFTQDWIKATNFNGSQMDKSVFREVNGDMVKPEKGDRELKTIKLKIVGVVDVPSESVIWADKMYTVMDNMESGSDLNVLTKLNEPGTEAELAKEVGVKFSPRNEGFMQDGYNQKSMTGAIGSQVKYRNYDDATYSTGMLTNPKTIVMLILTLIFSFMAIYTSFNISINKRIKYFGTLRALGGTNRQIASLLVRESLIVGILAIPLGIALAVVTLKGELLLSELIFNVDFSELRFGIEPGWIGTSIWVILIILMITSLRAVIKSQGLTPIEALRNTGVAEASSGEEVMDTAVLKEYIEKDEKSKVYKLLKKVFNIEGALAYKNLNRNFGRNITGITTLVGGMFIILCFIFQFINGEIQSDFTMESDRWNIRAKNIESSFTGDNIADIENIPGINKVYKDMKTSVSMTVKSNEVNPIIDKAKNPSEEAKLDEYDITLKTRGLDDKAVKLLNGVSKEELDNNGVVLVNKWTRLEVQVNRAGETLIYVDIDPVLKKKVGDKITVNSPTGTKELTIISIVDEDVLSENLNLNDRKNLTEDGCMLVSDKVFGELVGSNSDSSNLFIDITTDENRNEALKSLTDTFGSTLEITDYKEEADRIIQENKERLIWNVIFSITTIGMILVSITNILTANILSRKKELAALSSIGMDDGQRRKMIICESFVMALNACFVGFCIGGTVFTVFQMNNITQGKGSIGLNLSIVTVVVVSIGLLSTFLGLIPLRKISKMNITDLIKGD